MRRPTLSKRVAKGLSAIDRLVTADLEADRSEETQQFPDSHEVYDALQYIRQLELWWDSQR